MVMVESVAVASNVETIRLILEKKGAEAASTPVRDVPKMAEDIKRSQAQRISVDPNLGKYLDTFI